MSAIEHRKRYEIQNAKINTDEGGETHQIRKSALCAFSCHLGDHDRTAKEFGGGLAGKKFADKVQHVSRKEHHISHSKP